MIIRRFLGDKDGAREATEAQLLDARHGMLESGAGVYMRIVMIYTRPDSEGGGLAHPYSALMQAFLLN